ncbi:MAG: SRPBCC family protein [Candidatus Dormibacteria bacterium]
MIRNVHQREFAVDPALLADLLDHVAEPGNKLWPSPTWPPLRLDRPLAAGAIGGHGPIRYAVQSYRPGAQVVFRFDPSMWLVGTHSLEVLPGSGPGRAVLRHEITGQLIGRGRLIWPLVIRWLHDPLVEDLLDRAAMAVGRPPARPARWSWWVRRLRARKPRQRARTRPLAPTGR